MKQYRVYLGFHAGAEYFLEAECKADARDKVRDLFDEGGQVCNDMFKAAVEDLDRDWFADFVEEITTNDEPAEDTLKK